MDGFTSAEEYFQTPPQTPSRVSKNPIAEFLQREFGNLPNAIDQRILDAKNKSDQRKDLVSAKYLDANTGHIVTGTLRSESTIYPNTSRIATRKLSDPKTGTLISLEEYDDNGRLDAKTIFDSAGTKVCSVGYRNGQPCVYHLYEGGKLSAELVIRADRSFTGTIFTPIGPRPANVLLRSDIHQAINDRP